MNKVTYFIIQKKIVALNSLDSLKFYNISWDKRNREKSLRKVIVIMMRCLWASIESSVFESKSMLQRRVCLFIYA